MTIPLDRLYNFLYDLAGNNQLFFFRFFPHGSKHIDNLTLLNDVGQFRYSTKPTFLLCHDQEPLNWNLYSSGPGCTVNLRAVLAKFGSKYNKVMLLHSEKNSQELETYNKHRFVGVYYWSHALIARDWFRYANIDPNLVPLKTINKDFLVYNRAWSGTREYRLKFAELVLDLDLLPTTQIKFNPMDSDVCYRDHVFANPKFAINRLDLENHIELNTADSTASADYNSTDYNNTAIEVVLETLFDDQRWHLTEKILRPIACGQPFMLAATPGSLEYLKSYGFRTFSGLIDESYDQIQDPLARLEAIVWEMKRIADLTTDNKQDLYQRLQDIANFNKQHFFSTAFFAQVVKEYQTNFQAALNTFG